ncbi:MAG: glycosyltransferase family 2 protein [Cyclobacteriaceae bacterium]
MNITQLLNTPVGILSRKRLIDTNDLSRVTRGKTQERLLDKITQLKCTPLDCLVLISTFFLLLSAAFLVFELQPFFHELHLDRMDTTWGKVFIITSLILLSFRLCFIVYIFVLHKRYKPIASVADEKLPACTVIVPAYNEGKLVWKTLRSLAQNDYPVGKLQIICIDDGSKDDTWQWMKKAKQEIGDLVNIYQQPKNMGKRQALYRGFHMATGDVFVTVDSDSIVKKDTLRNLVTPIVTSEKCGAVAGNVRVLNNKKAIIPKMLNVSFVFSFEFVRSAQSELGSVLCTPGALAAYRREAAMNCLPQWIDQTFMGKPSDIGEDRAMTNMILKQGYEVKFQSNAYVLTDTPEKYKNLYKMFIRWERSNVRENIMMSKFALKNFRKGPKAGTRFLLLNQWLRVLTAYPMMLIMLCFIALHPVLFITSTLLSILIFSSIPALFFARRHTISESIWAYTYGIFHTFALFWITPYAIATVSKRGWLTRG